MRIATWNVNRVVPVEARAERIRGHLAEHDVDVWILTETSTELSPGRGWRGVFSAPRSDARSDERWVAIWCRAENSEALTTSDPDRTVAARVRSGHGRDLVIYGTVLPWLGSCWREHPAKGGAAFGAALSAQAADWARLSNAHPEAGLCLAGDFNQDLNDRHYYGSADGRQLLQCALDKAGVVCLTSGERDPVARITGQKRGNIDHVCGPRDLVTAESTSWAWPNRTEDLKALSDHFGVGVEF